MKNYTLGINAFHADSSAALLCDGHVISATEEKDLQDKNIGQVYQLNPLNFV